MDHLFQKAVIFTDSHFGRSSDDPIANQDNLDFLQWMIARARSWDADTCLFLGDFYDNRHAIGLHSMQAALQGLEMLSAAGFKRIIFLIGNHDIAKKTGREVSSINFAKHLPNITVIDNPIVSDDVAFLPWLVPDEIAHVGGYPTRYVFGHFETVGAMMNSQITCGESLHALSVDRFKKQDQAFTGHFHRRQELRNLIYIGSVMPFDFSDANDSQRGITLLHWGHDPVFEHWPEQPLYCTLNLSEVLGDNADLRAKMTVRLTVDMPLRYEDAQEIRDSLISLYDLRKVEMRNLKTISDAVPLVVEQQTIDQIMLQGLRGIDSVGLSPARLIDLYNRL